MHLSLHSQLLAGGDKTQYLLDDIKTYKYLNQSGCYKLDDVDDARSFEQLCMAMTGLRYSMWRYCCI
jgi:myosin heavy subunit